ncbi:hypothetical protein MRBLMG1_005679 [Streptomyces sp. LMG1-1-1.1]
MLALGVFLMHAVGHPAGSGGGMDTASASSASSPAGPAHAAGSGASHGTGSRHNSEGSGRSGSFSSHSPSGSHGSDGGDARHDPGTGMDMTTLCVAVLGAWLLAGLVRAALGRRPEWLTLLLARLTPVLGPHAPPRRPPDLARLSVLRI